ncbi:WD40-repeat-containing domain protein [Auriculariales sp. MPI-PUGE-AT-0066]|nr:WD40-repeat-containing domain protein [Auriculariales sp. MPI-PUGE-AT-0066]
MSSQIYSHRNLPPTVPAGAGQSAERLQQCLDTIKAEFDAVMHENSAVKSQRDDYELVTQQVNELNIIRQALYDLEAQHSRIRQQYEDEITKLRMDLHAARAQVQTHLPGLAPSSAETIANRHPAIGAETRGPIGGGSDIRTVTMERERAERERAERERADQLLREQHLASSRPNLERAGTGGAGPSGFDRGQPLGPGGPQDRDRIMSGAAAPEHRPESRATGRYDSTTYTRIMREERERERASRDHDERDAKRPKTEKSESYSGLHNKTGSTSSRYAPEMPQHPATPSLQQPQSSFAPAQQAPHPDEIDPNAWPAEYRKSGPDWTAFFNPNVPRQLDVSLSFTFMHESVVCCVKFSADGRYLATGCNRAAHIYDMRNGEKTHVLIDPSAAQNGDLYIRSVAWSPDGKYLATGAEDKVIRLWDIGKQRIRQVYEGHTQEIYSLDFSRDGSLIVSGSGDRTARIWERDSTDCKVLSIDEPESVDAGVTSVAISPDGRHVAAGSLDTVVRIWDVTTGSLVERLMGHSDSVYSVSFTPDGKGLLSGSLDKTLKYWDVSQLGRKQERGSTSQGESSATCIKDFRGHRDYVLSVAVSHEAQYIVSGSKDRGVQFWDARTAQVQLTLQGHKNSVISIDLSPTSNFLATGSGDSQARVWRYGRVGERID